MQMLFQAARDAANEANRIAKGHAGTLPTTEKEHTRPYVHLEVSVGYQRGIGEGEGVHFKDVVTSAKVNRLVKQYLEGHIKDALDYAVKNLEGQADIALVSSKQMLTEYVAQIEALEAAGVSSVQS